MTRPKSKTTADVINAILSECWRQADRHGLNIVTHGDDTTITTSGRLVVIRKCPLVCALKPTDNNLPVVAPVQAGHPG